ncbi:MAG: OmpA family protein [Bryobacteraceae bacterium]
MRAAALLTAAAALLLGWLCTRRHAPAIEADLLVRSRQALEAAGIPAAGLAFDGRDAVLRGVAGTAEVSARARDLVAGVWGVRVANVETTQPPPAPPREAVQQKLTELVRLKNIEFETASARITPRGLEILNEVAAVLAGAGNMAVAIEGHTDNRGKADANLVLSRARAVAVREYLIAKGIAAGRMTAEGYGAERPVQSNASAAGRQANRRIEFVVKQ